jgi:hypothetical protein
LQNPNQEKSPMPRQGKPVSVNFSEMVDLINQILRVLHREIPRETPLHERVLALTITTLLIGAGCEGGAPAPSSEEIKDSLDRCTDVMQQGALIYLEYMKRLQQMKERKAGHG